MTTAIWGRVAVTRDTVETRLCAIAGTTTRARTGVATTRRETAVRVGCSDDDTLVVELDVGTASVVLGDDVVVRIAATGNAVASITVPTTPNASVPVITWRRCTVRGTPESTSCADVRIRAETFRILCPCVNFFMGTSVRNETHPRPYVLKTCPQFTRLVFTQSRGFASGSYESDPSRLRSVDVDSRRLC